MKVALCLSDASHRNMDFTTPQLGNTGTGGSTYCVLMLMYALATFSDVELNVYHQESSNKLIKGVGNYIYHNYKELYSLVKAHGNDILVMNINSYVPIAEYDPDINYVIWIHNYREYDTLDELSASSAVKRVVFVGREHYDHYIDHPVIKKSVPIFNMFDGRHFKLRDLPAEPSVTYTGGLYWVKGFHVLASMWKDILREVPNAKLYVVGSGKLYDEKIELGSWGVATKDYEAMLSEYLTIDGKLMPSVNFCGLLGSEKSEVYYKTTVGVMNPWARTETFGMSAVDMEACGVPVVTKAANGLFDSVKHGVSGLLGRNSEEIKRYIILLLKDKELNIKLGRQAKEFVENSFLPEILVKQWLEVFDDIMNNRPAKYIKPSGHYTNNLKWLKVIAHWLAEYHIANITVMVAWKKIKTFIKIFVPAPVRKLLRRK